MSARIGRESLCFLMAQWVKRTGLSKDPDTAVADLILVVEPKGFRVVKDRLSGRECPRVVPPDEAVRLLQAAAAEAAA